MSPNESLDPNLLQNMIRQRQLLGTFGNGGIPSSAQPPAQPPTPDMTVHVHHALGLPDAQPQVTPQAQAAMTPQEPSTQTGVPPLTSSIPAPAASTPKIGPINPNSANPAESAYKQSLMNEPMKADYHPSTTRKVLSALAGGAEGFFGGAKAGMQLHDSLRNGPYNTQHQDWAQNSGNKEKLAIEEAAGNTTTGKEALTAAQTGEQNSLAALHGNESNNKIHELSLMPGTHDQAVADKVTEAQGHLRTDTREAKMLDGTTAHLIQKNGLFYNPEKLMPDGSMLRVDRAAIEDISDEGKTLKETKTSRIPGNLGQSIQTKKIIAAGVGGKTDDGTTVDQPTFDAAKELDAKLARGDDPKGAFDSIVVKRNSERVAAGKPPMSSNDLEALQTKLLSVEKPGGVLMVNPSDNKVGKYGPGSVLPSGAQTPQQLGTSEQKSQKELEDLKADQSFVNDYQNNQSHTGPGDEALLERFFNATKPSTGFRMNQAQIALLTKLRSFSSGVKAFIAHQTGGTLFDDKQRGEIVDQINAISNAKQAAHGGKSAQTDSLPGGISIQDIDAEIDRRKGGK